MKIMKTCTLLSLVTILVNCGGDDSSSSPSTVSSLSKQARSNQASGDSLGFREQSSRTSSTKMQLKVNQKLEGPIACEIAGTYYYEKEATDTGGAMTRFINKECQAIDIETGKVMEENGLMVYLEDENSVGVGVGYQEYTVIPDINKQGIIESFPSLTIVTLNDSGFTLFGINGEVNYITDGKNIEETYKYQDYYYISNDTYVHIEGSETIITPCGRISNFYADYNGDFNFLSKHDTNSRYYKEGIIVVNGLKYDYKGEKVILSKNGEEETVSQASILAIEDAVSSCSQKTAFSYEKIDVPKVEKGEYQDTFKRISLKLKAHISKRNMKK